MAYLSLNALEPVEFGGRECAPRLDAETKMRLSQIKQYNAKAIEVLASAFPDDEDYVEEFLGGMTVIDLQLLHAYLLGGQTMVESIRGQLNGAMDSVMKEGK